MRRAMHFNFVVKPQVVRTVVSLCVLLSLPVGMLQAAAPVDLTDPEKNKIKGIITLMEKAWAACKDQKLKDTLAGTGDQMEYEMIDSDGDGAKDDDPTFGDALKHLKDMVDNDKIRKKAGIGRGQVDVKEGVDNDTIFLNKATVEKACNIATSGVDKVSTKLYLGATLANEMTHVYHKWIGGTNKQKCDAEKDSDCSSIKFLEAIKDALEKDGSPGMPNTTVAGIDGDANKVEGLKRCFDNSGVSSAADIAKVYQNICNRLGKEESSAGAGDGKGYKGRKERFEADIAAATFRNWATWYYGGHDASENETSHYVDEVFRSGTSMVGTDLSTTAFYPVPFGQIVVNSRSFRNAQDEVMLATVSADGLGIRFLSIWRDIDDDDLPDTFLGSTFLNESEVAIPSLFEYPILPGVPSALHSLGTNDGLLLHDKQTGQFFQYDMDSVGTPLGSRKLLFQDPAIQVGNFDFLQVVTAVDAFSTIFVFGQNEGVVGDGNVIWFTVNNATGFASATTDPGLFFAEAIGPLNSVGVDFIAQNQTQMRFFGEPFSSIQLFAVGQGIQQFITFGDTDETGMSPLVGPFAPLQGNELYLVDDGNGNIALHLIPRIGQPIGHVSQDDNGDGLPDLIYLSDGPRRLHFLSKSLSAPPAVHEHQVEVALEPFDVGGFSSWNDVDGRNIIGAAFDTEIIALNVMSVEPLYVQSVHDFDNDAIANEAVVVSLPTGGAQWQVTLITGVNTTPVELIQLSLLPMGFEPDVIQYADFGNDGFLDLQISDFNGGPDVCLTNTGNGGDPLQRFVAGECVIMACPGDADGSGTVNFADITSVLSNWLNDYTPGTGPGDANGDGVVNFTDITTVLSNWLNVCP